MNPLILEEAKTEGKPDLKHQWTSGRVGAVPKSELILLIQVSHCVSAAVIHFIDSFSTFGVESLLAIFVYKDDPRFLGSSELFVWLGGVWKVPRGGGALA